MPLKLNTVHLGVERRILFAFRRRGETCERLLSRVERQEEKRERRGGGGIAGQRYCFLLSTSFQLVEIYDFASGNILLPRVFLEISIRSTSNRIPTRKGEECTAVIEKKLFLHVHPSTLYILFPSSLVAEKLRVIRSVAERLTRLANNRCRNIPSSHFSSYFSSNRILPLPPAGPSSFVKRHKRRRAIAPEVQE